MLADKLLKYEHTIDITLKHEIGRFRICYYFLEISYYRDLIYNGIFRENHKIPKFKYFAKVILYLRSPDHVLIF